MDDIIHDLMNGAPLSKYSPEEQQKLLMPLALAKKEAQFQRKIDDVEKLDRIINQLQLIPETVPAPIATMRQTTLTRSGKRLVNSSLSLTKPRTLMTSHTLRTVDSENDEFNERYLNKERNRLIELRDSKRQILLEKHRKELEAIPKPVVREMKPYSELQVCTKLIQMKKEKEDKEKELEAKNSSLQADKRSSSDARSQRSIEEDKYSHDLVKSLKIKRSNEEREHHYREMRQRVLDRQKEELEHFDREWYLKLLEFEGSKQEIRSFAQSLPVLKQGTYTRYLRTRNTFSYE